MLPLEALGEDPSLPLPALVVLGVPCGYIAASLSPSSCAFLSFLVVSSALLSLVRTLVIGFRIHWGNPGWAHLEIFNLIPSAEFLFPNKVPFTGSGWAYHFCGGWLGGAPFYLVQWATGQTCGHHKRTSWAWWEVLAKRREADLRQT